MTNKTAVIFMLSGASCLISIALLVNNHPFYFLLILLVAEILWKCGHVE